MRPLLPLLMLLFTTCCFFSAKAFTPIRPLGRYMDPDGFGGFVYVYSDGIHPEFNSGMDDSFQGIDAFDADFVDDLAVNWFDNSYNEFFTEGDFTGTGQGFDADDTVVQVPFDPGIMLLLVMGFLVTVRVGSLRKAVRLSN